VRPRSKQIYESREPFFLSSRKLEWGKT
jgi:hypothetical protein